MARRTSARAIEVVACLAHAGFSLGCRKLPAVALGDLRLEALLRIGVAGVGLCDRR